jgi:hypothetical protein
MGEIAISGIATTTMARSSTKKAALIIHLTYLDDGDGCLKSQAGTKSHLRFSPSFFFCKKEKEITYPY